MVEDIFSEKKLIEETELLKDIKKTWQEFTEFVILVDKCILATKEEFRYSVVYPRHINSILDEGTQLTIYKRKYAMDDYIRLIDEFKHVLNKYPFEEMLANYNIGQHFTNKSLKDINDAKNAVSDFMEFFEKYVTDIYDLINMIQKMHKIKSEPFMHSKLVASIRNIHNKIESKYDISVFQHLSTFIQEIDALIKVTTQNLVNHETAKKLCEKKLIDLNSQGFLYHYTTDNFWHTSSIVKFIKEGLKPSVQLGRGTSTIYENMLCFTLSCGEKYPSYGPITFILNPEYVAKHSTDFYYNPERANKNDPHSPNFIPLCEKLGFKMKPDDLRMSDIGFKNAEWPNEVQTLYPVPFSAITAIMITDKLAYRMQFFMTKLCHKYPELTVPIYNKSKELIWPL